MEAPRASRCRTPKEAIITTLSDTQLVILSAAARRQDGAVLPLPRSLRVNKAAATTVLNSPLTKSSLDEFGLV